MTEMNLIKIVEAAPQHLPEILCLNEAAVPHVNSLSMAALQELSNQARLFLVALDSKESVVGFILTMDESAIYASPNFQFFKSEFSKFVYVDRIVIADSAQGTGVGKRLYQHVIERVAGDSPYLTCEVNIKPPNPQSLKFHQRIGFSQLAEQVTENGSKTVSLMVKNLDTLEAGG